MVKTHNSQIPDDLLESDVVGRSIHIPVAYLALSKENRELKATLATRPALPDPAVIYTKKITERQNQVAEMQETLSTMAREAYDLLKGLHEC